MSMKVCVLLNLSCDLELASLKLGVLKQSA